MLSVVRRNTFSLVAKIIVLLMALNLIACDMAMRDQPPLHRAAYFGDVEKIKVLLKAGEKVNAQNKEGATPLHWAAFKGHEAAAKALLNAGANVNARTKKGSTPLGLATTYKQEALIRLLKQRGGEI